MSRSAVLACLLLAACEPVLLVADEGGGGIGSGQTPVTPARDAGPEARERDAEVAEDATQTGAASAPAPENTDQATPEVLLSVKAVDCGSCFDILASGKGGAAPYEYEWEDGSRGQSRRVCVGASQHEVWVVATDSAGARSNAHVTHLQTDSASDDCPDTTSAVKMCLENPSFEGEPAINTGQAFDASPWTTCTDPADGNMTNTPDVASDVLDPVTGIAPIATQGTTYLAMSTGEQASQQLCEALTARSSTSLRLDVARMNIGSPEMFLQIWGGSSADCSRRQLLWVSPALTPSWTTFCVKLEPSEFMDLITLRAETPMPDIVINYLAVDNLLPVDACP